MDTNEGYLLIIVTTIVLFAFIVCFLIIMMIYRKRKIEHAHEVEVMNERFEKELLNMQLETQQQTMQYIGREIHDNVGQQLTLASLYTQQAETGNINERVKEKINSVASIINASLKDLRNLSKSLTEANMPNENLYESIDKECKKINALGACNVILMYDAKHIKVSQPVKNFVVRILQEAMQNSLKHASCSEIKLQFKDEAEGLYVYDTDNGKGFDISQILNKGIGLKNMKKRAEMIGGELSINSKPGKGTELCLFIPANKLLI